MTEGLVVNEIFLSIQGESSFAGLPCVFVRLTGCNLRCSFCDTAYAFTEGQKMSLDEVASKVHRLGSAFPAGAAGALGHRVPLIELTGGEPLLQVNCLELMRRFCDEGFTVLIETSGARDISGIDARVHRIMDLKCPSSGEVSKNRWENLRHLKATDEIKFVVGTREDYEWMRQVIVEHELAAACPLLVSWVQPLTPVQREPSLKPMPAGQTVLTRRELVERVLADSLPVRFQAQLHKLIWPPDQRGV